MLAYIVTPKYSFYNTVNPTIMYQKVRTKIKLKANWLNYSSNPNVFWSTASQVHQTLKPSNAWAFAKAQPGNSHFNPSGLLFSRYKPTQLQAATWSYLANTTLPLIFPLATLLKAS